MLPFTMLLEAQSPHSPLDLALAADVLQGLTVRPQSKCMTHVNHLHADNMVYVLMIGTRMSKARFIDYVQWIIALRKIGVLIHMLHL